MAKTNQKKKTKLSVCKNCKEKISNAKMKGLSIICPKCGEIM